MKLRNKKTGEIVRVEFLSNWQTDDGTEIGFRECNTNIVYSYNTLAELNADWEDYKPQEPLIKDENIRKAVRLWAYINDIETATYDEIHHDRGLNVFFFEDTEEENVIIQFYGWIPTLKEGEIHTITELCGGGRR